MGALAVQHEVGSKNHVIVSRNQANGDVLGEVPVQDEAEIRAAVARAREAQKPWGELPTRERCRRVLAFRDAQTMKLHHALDVSMCPGVDHMDFTFDGRTALVSCEFSGRMIVVDLVHERVRKTIALSPLAMPQDVKLSPDGRTFYIADMASNGVWLVNAKTMKTIRFMHTGAGAHGLYPSRDSKTLYVSNRGEGSISLIDFRTRRMRGKWHIPGGGSPDMGGVSADGRVLWLTGRYNGVVYGISTRTGHLLHRIPVGSGPHGMCVWPQPGRYSIGHTGILR